MARGACCILLAVALFAPAVRRIYKANVVGDAQLSAARATVVIPAAVLPEPGERTAYIVGCLSAIPLLLGLLVGVHAMEGRAAGAPFGRRLATTVAALMAVSIYSLAVLRGLDYFAIHASFACGIAGLLYLSRALPVAVSPRWAQVGECVALAGWFGFVAWSLWSSPFFAARLNEFFLHPLWALPLPLLGWWAMSWLDRKSWCGRCCERLLLYSALAIVGFVGLLGTRGEYATDNSNFGAAFDPVSQVQMGKDVLVDYDSQYGLYPDLLAPVFALGGLSVVKYMALFALMNVGSFGLLYWALRNAVARRSIALFGILAMIFNSWLIFQLEVHAAHPSFFDPYFQYMPIRFIFPACAVALTAAYLRSRSARVYWIAHIWLAVGLLWNLDSGFVALAAWTGALIFDALYETPIRSAAKTVVGHLLNVLLSVGGVVAAYAAIKYAWFGEWPQFGRFLKYQRLFYITGFNMLPMPPFGMWQLVVLAYVVGIVQSLAALLTRRRDATQTLVFMISVLGLGLFSYYQGRSHDRCLMICCWPAPFLLAIYWDQLRQLSQLPGRHLFAAGLGLAIGMFLISSAASFVVRIPQVCRLTFEQTAGTMQTGSLFDDDVRMLREHVRGDEEMLILSDDASVIHFAAGIPSMAPGPLVQMLLRAQYDDLVAKLAHRGHAWIFIGRDYLASNLLGLKVNEGTKILMTAIQPHLIKIADSAHGTLYEYRRDLQSTEDLSAK